MLILKSVTYIEYKLNMGTRIFICNGQIIHLLWVRRR
jgi:hypothetical protein